MIRCGVFLLLILFGFSSGWFSNSVLTSASHALLDSGTVKFTSNDMVFDTWQVSDATSTEHDDTVLG